MSQHTPGRWTAKPSVHGNEYRYVQIGADESYTTLEVLPADANLIAAAPDMLAVLQHLYNHGYTVSSDHDMVRDVLAKATGQPKESTDAAS